MAFSPAPKDHMKDLTDGEQFGSIPADGKKPIGTIDLSQTQSDDLYLRYDETLFKQVSSKRRRVLRLYERAVAWDNATAKEGATGRIRRVMGLNAVFVLESLIFHHDDYKYALRGASPDEIARRTGRSVGKARKALADLQVLGIISYDRVRCPDFWWRRNYVIFKEEYWKGYTEVIPLIDAYEKRVKEELEAYFLNSLTASK